MASDKFLYRKHGLLKYSLRPLLIIAGAAFGLYLTFEFGLKPLSHLFG